MNHDYSQCRACLIKTEDFTSIYDDDLANIITELTTIQIDADDNFPKTVCASCKCRLIDAKKIKDQCLKSYKILSSSISIDLERHAQIYDENCDKNESVAETGYEEVQDLMSQNKLMRIKDESENLEIEDFDDETENQNHKLQTFDITGKTCIKIGYKIRQLKCTENGCERKFQRQDRFEAHLREHVGEKPEICNVCGKGLANIRSLTRHIKLHNAERNYHCQFCEKTFRTTNALKIHENVHTKEKQYICDLCGQIFLHRTGLSIHLSRHTDEKKYNCDKCPRVYKSKRELEDHLIRHKGIRDHVCGICTKTFLVKKDLKLHERSVHQAKYQFQCTECQRKYRKKCQLDIHLRSHTNERPYVCTYCDKAFRVKQTMIKHTYSHTGERPFRCNVCPKAYTEIFILKRHIRQQHPEVMK